MIEHKILFRRYNAHFYHNKSIMGTYHCSVRIHLTEIHRIVDNKSVELLIIYRVLYRLSKTCDFDFFVILLHLFRITSNLSRITSSLWYYFQTFCRITSPFWYYFHPFTRITSPFLLGK